MGKRFFVVAGVLLSAALAVSGAHAALDNPFARAAEVNIGADSDWRVDAGSISKTGRGDDGLYYKLSLHKNQLSLKIGKQAEVETDPKSYKALAIEDLRIDGKRLPLFQWCLNHQQNHNRFLQQDLEVKDGICMNHGERGEFVVMLNRQTLDLIENGERLRFVIRPFRKPVHVNYDISDFSEAYAILQARAAASQRAAASAPAPVAVQPAPVVKPVEVQMCKLAAPQDFASVAAQEYVCGDAADKRRAQQRIDTAVKQAQQRRQRIAAEKEKQRLAAIAAQQKAEEERRKAEQARKAEEAAIAASEQKRHQIMDELTKKMVGVCNKVWSKGKHRCYCERYIEYAPPGIQSDASCKREG